jgi:hypothetical protein
MDGLKSEAGVFVGIVRGRIDRVQGGLASVLRCELSEFEAHAVRRNDVFDRQRGLRYSKDGRRCRRRRGVVIVVTATAKDRREPHDHGPRRGCLRGNIRLAVCCIRSAWLWCHCDERLGRM